MRQQLFGTNAMRAFISAGVVIGACLCSPTIALALNISEFRVRGPNGANDEFIELYNDSNAPLTVSSPTGSTGWAVAASNGAARFVIPNSTVIPARGTTSE